MAKKAITWTNERRKLSDLIPWERNPRTIKNAQAERLVDSVETFGQVETLAIDCDNNILNGHQRLSVLAGQYGMDYEVDVRVASRPLTERERQQLTVYLHRGAAGEWEPSVLFENFDVDDLTSWGFESEELDAMFADFQDAPESSGADTPAQIDKAEELRQKWNVATGQLWALGEHRLICGDCTDKAVAERVMGGEKANMVFTDPPYNVDVAGGSHDPRDTKNYRSGGIVENDKMSSKDFYAFLCATFAQTLSVMNSGASFYVCFSDSEIKNFVNAFCTDDIHYAQMIIWKKQQLVFGRKDYHSKHEPILYGWKTGAAHYFTDDRTLDTVWEIDRPMRSEKEHPTQKPVALYEKAFANSSKIGSIIYEPFSGSGTAIIACQNLNRRCRAVEISPGYVAVALQRFFDHTGIQPELIS